MIKKHAELSNSTLDLNCFGNLPKETEQKIIKKYQHQNCLFVVQEIHLVLKNQYVSI